MGESKNFWQSKRFWLGVGTVIFALVGEQLGVTEEQIQKVVAIVASLIVGDSLRGVSYAAKTP